MMSGSCCLRIVGGSRSFLYPRSILLGRLIIEFYAVNHCYLTLVSFCSVAGVCIAHLLALNKPS